jgi:peptide/nickel transport system permease protein
MTAIAAEPTEAIAAEATNAGPGFVRRLIRRPLAIVCLSWLAIVIVVAIVAPIALPDIGGQHAGNLLITRQGPSVHHLLGTDSLGRDVLDRLLVGTRITVLGVVYTLVVALVLGVPFGIAAGYFGGLTDRAVGWMADIAFSLPAIILIVVVLSVFPQSMLAAMVTFGVLTAPGLMRVVRAATLPVARQLYVAAAQVSGMSRPYIITRHVLPRIAGPIIVQASLIAAAALLVQTGLAFLGLVAAPPAPSWGGMVADGVNVLSLDSWLIWPPGIAIALTALSLGLLGDVVRDVNAETWSSTPVGLARRRRRTRRRAGRAERPALAEDPPASEPAADRGPASDVLLSVRDLTVVLDSRDGPQRVVENVSFEMRQGEIVAVVGESGCGKTMTAMAILGLLPGVASIESGSITFAGRDLTELPGPQLRRVRGKEIGLVSQEPMVSLNPAFRVGWQLAEAVRLHHDLPRKEANRRAVELLDSVLIPDSEAVARRYPHELSGGMAQRVVIARALAGSPKLLIADEPTTALDVTTQADILELLRTLQRERGMAVMLVTHDLGVVADICQRMFVMYAGEVVERGTVDDVFAGPLQPYTRALLASNPHNSRVGDVLPTIPGSVPPPGAWPAGCHFAARCPLAADDCRERPIPMLEPRPGRDTRCIHSDLLAGG